MAIIWEMEKPFQFLLNNPSSSPGGVLASGMQIHVHFLTLHLITSLITIWILLSLKAAGHLGNQKPCQLDSIQVQLQLPDQPEAIHPCWNTPLITAEGLRPAQENGLLTDWLACPPTRVIYVQWRKTNGTLARSFHILLGALPLLSRVLGAVTAQCRGKKQTNKKPRYIM